VSEEHPSQKKNEVSNNINRGLVVYDDYGIEIEDFDDDFLIAEEVEKIVEDYNKKQTTRKCNFRIESTEKKRESPPKKRRVCLF
jgi:hypothetical protein